MKDQYLPAPWCWCEITPLYKTDQFNFIDGTTKNRPDTHRDDFFDIELVLKIVYSNIIGE